MSVESWGGDSACYVRFHFCGHSVLISEVRVVDPASLECPVCGELSPLRAEASVPDIVPSADLAWQGAKRTKLDVLETGNRQNGLVTSVEDLVAAIAAHPPGISLQDLTLHPTSRPTGNQRRKFIVWKASSFGCQVSGGTISLLPDCVLLLNGRGAHFRDTTFSGGVVMCAEREFSGSFQKCSFVSCALYAVHGASASLSDCTWRDCPAALVAHGPTTTATLTGCTLRGCRFCVIAEAGASVSMHASEILTHGVAVVVNDPGSHFTAEDSVLAGARRGAHGELLACAVRTHRGTAGLHRCTIDGFTHGVVTAGSAAALELHSSCITACARAVALSDKSWGAITECHMHACAPPAGTKGDCTAVTLSDSSRLAALRCEVRATAKGEHPTALSLWCGGRAALVLCRIKSPGAGVGLRDAGTSATFTDCKCTSKGNGYSAKSEGSAVRVSGGAVASAQGAACIALQGATLSLSDVQLQAGAPPSAPPRVGNPFGVPPLATVSLFDGSRGRLLRCTVRDSLAGVLVEDGRVRVKDTCIADMHAVPGRARADPVLSHACICRGGEVDWEGGSITDVCLGFWVGPRDPRRGAVRVRGTVLRRYSHAAQIAEGCDADFDWCQFQGTAGVSRVNQAATKQRMAVFGELEEDFEAAVVAMMARRLHLVGCTFSGHTLDVCAMDVPSPEGEAGDAEGQASCNEAQIRNCEFRGVVSGGACVRARMRTRIEHCTFAGACTAVAARDSLAVCTLRHCTVAAGMRCGVESADGASVAMVHCEVRATEGAHAAYEGTLTVQDCTFVCSRAAMQVNYSGGVLWATRVSARGGKWGAVAASNCPAAAAPVPLPRVEMRLEECTLAGSQAAVEAFGPAVDLSLAGCDLGHDMLLSGAGVCARGGAVVRVRKTTVSHCVYGIEVGERFNLERPCEVCGIEGPEGMQAAWRALTRAAQGRGQGAHRAPLCAHQGARARVTLEDVEIQACEKVGVCVSRHGVVDACGVRSSRCDLAFSVGWVAGLERSQFRQCTAVRSGTGRGAVVVDKQQVGPEEGDAQRVFAIHGVDVVEDERW